MALPALPFDSSLSAEDAAEAARVVEYDMRHATRALVEKAMHYLNNLNYSKVDNTGVNAVAFRTALFGSYLPAMLVEEVERAFIENADGEAGDFARLYDANQDPVKQTATYTNVAVSDVAPITNPVANI